MDYLFQGDNTIYPARRNTRSYLINTRPTVDGVLLGSTAVPKRPKNAVLSVYRSVLFTLVPIYEIASSEITYQPRYRCSHRSPVVVSATGDEVYRARCLACSTVGPERRTSEKAYEALMTLSIGKYKGEDERPKHPPNLRQPRLGGKPVNRGNGADL